jgi:guanylate kinase
MSPTGILFVVSAPSGAGKTSLLKALVEQMAGLVVSVSHTTRVPRPGEKDGVHYHFVDIPRFEAMVANGEFLEHARVFGNFYGTSAASVRHELQRGADVVLEIDWQGARQVRKHFPDAVSIFVVPPSLEELRRRLSARGQDSVEVVEQRMGDALRELSHFPEYEYVVVNERFEEALRDLQCLMRAERLRGSRQHDACAARFAVT